MSKIKKVTILLSIIFGLYILLTTDLLYSEWFQFLSPIFALIFKSLCYLLGLLFIGNILKLTKKKNLGSQLTSSILTATLTLLPFLIFGIWKGSYEFNKKRTIYLKELELLPEKEAKKYSVNYQNLSDSIQKDSANADLWVKRGLLSRHNGKWDLSIYDYKKALILDSMNYSTNFEIAYSLQITHQKSASDSFYRIAVNIDSNTYFARKHPEYLK